MSQRRKTFDPGFKLQVVQLIKEQGLSVAQVCRDMSLGETAVRLHSKLGYLPPNAYEQQMEEKQPIPVSRVDLSSQP
ncbi:MAG: transposase, partial [Candidatus Accumulibacter sp.]|nr:transposase [Accumulibacter sp.]